MIELFLQYALKLGMQGPMRCHEDLTVLVELDLVGRVLEARVGNNVGLVHGFTLQIGEVKKQASACGSL